MTKTRARANGEGSIYPYRNGFAAYVWVSTPAGKRRRKYVYGKDRETVHNRWVELHRKAREGPVVTKVPTLTTYVNYWLAEVVRPNLAPATAANYDMFARRYVLPALGGKRLDRLQVADVRAWLNRVRQTCQCCAQGKDAARPARQRRCCAVGKCCRQLPSEWTCRDAWMTLRAALSNAVRDEVVSRNVAALVRVPMARRRKSRSWTVDEARAFLESARSAADPLYAAYVLVLVLGLRRGELLGLGWDDIDLDAGELYVQWQLQRIEGHLVRRRTKTASSDAPLPLPDICAAALRERRKAQDVSREQAGEAWQDDIGFVFTTRYGTPMEPRNFNRSFKARCAKAGVPAIPVHSTRRTCASLLVALDVHPRVAMQVLRHSQIAVTMNVYSEVASEDTRAALKQLGERLSR